MVTPSGPGSDDAAVVDDLSDVAAAPSTARQATILLMVAVMAGAAGMLFALRGDIGFFFSPAQPTVVGEVAQIAPARLPSNRLVRVEGTAMLAYTASYERLLSGSRYAVFPLAGQRNVFVHMPESRARDLQGRQFVGRLVTFEEAGARFAPLLEHFRSKRSLPVSGDTFLLLDGDEPSGYLWAVFLGALCLLLILADAALLLYWFWPLPVALPQRSVSTSG